MFISFILYFISLNINCPDKENYDKCLQFKIFYSKTILILVVISSIINSILILKSYKNIIQLIY